MTIEEGSNVWIKSDSDEGPVSGLRLAVVNKVVTPDPHTKSFRWDDKNKRYVYASGPSKLAVTIRFTERWDDEATVDPEDVVAQAQVDFLDTLDSDYQFEFFGVDGTAFKLGDDTLVAVEDPNDGYRSYLGTVATLPDGYIFFKNKLADVFVIPISEENHGDYESAFDGHALVDAKDGHVWLFLGTAHTDDYYPTFIFNYTPKPEAK